MTAICSQLNQEMGRVKYNNIIQVIRRSAFKGLSENFLILFFNFIDRAKELLLGGSLLDSFEKSPI